MGDSRLWSTIVENGLEPADLAWLALAMNRADQRRVEAEAALAEGLMGHSQAVVDAISGVRNATNGVEMREAERAVHAVLRAEGDALVECALQLRALDEDFVEQARADAHSRAQASGTRLHSRGYKSTPVRLLGGSIISLLALFLSPATPKSPEARRSRGKRGSAGAGVYPALDALGIADRASPALRETVAREVVAAFSFDAARGTLRQQGIEMDHRAALRLTYAFAEDAMKAREHAFTELLEPAEVLEGALAGRDVVVSLDGGRIRMKEAHGDVASDTRKYDAQWREPKVLTLYVVDADGKRDKKFKTLIDGTMGDADDVTALLVGYLRLLGAHLANKVQFIADGGSWIWSRAEAIREAVGIPIDRWYEQLDLPHTVAYLGRVLDQLPQDAIDRKTWLAEQKVSLLIADVDEIQDALRHLAEVHDIDVHAALAFFDKHRHRLRFLFCRSDGLPLGSGAVESAIRRVVNLRLKGNGKFWLSHHAEAVMHLRSQLVTGRWDEMVATTLGKPAWTPRQAA